MVVQHNLTAMNANRMLGITTGQQAKSSEKLSSGYKINRAADDAAGLSISEKMRKQINGLDRASTNAEDGVSAVQTAEGALAEVHSMLQRMNELSVQAANGTNSLEDREAIQAEIEQLTTEIDRVAETTKFNETYLLKGNVEGLTKEQTIAAHDAGIAGKLTDNGNGTSAFALNEPLENGDKIVIAGKEYTIGQPTTINNYELLENMNGDTADIDLSVGDSVTVDGITKTLTNDISMASLADHFDNSLEENDTLTTIDGKTYTYDGTSKWTDDDGAKVSSTDLAIAKSTAGTVFTSAATKEAHTVVVTLAGGEVSTYNILTDADDTVTAKELAEETSDANQALTLAEGSSITKNGKVITATNNTYEALSFGNVKTGIFGSAAGKQVKIGDIDATNVETYEIVENAADEDTDATPKKLTRESIIALIKEGNTVEYTDKAGNPQTVTAAGVDSLGEDTITIEDAYQKIKDELTAASSVGTDNGAKVINNLDGTFDIIQGTVEVKEKLSFNLHVGTEADMTNKIGVDIEAMTAAGLGIKGLNVADDTGMAATYAIDAIADALSEVSAQRSSLGAIQNRLEHTIANLDNVVENTTAAESRIRDTDMAEQMVEYSKNNILQQAGQSMLAQANQATQGVLSLLQ